MSAGGVLAACDLDGTLIYSRAALRRGGHPRPSRGGLVCVERHHNRPWSYLSARAAAHAVQLAQLALFVPATTRTPDQYAQVRLPGGPPPYAVCSNGAHLLCEGISDLDWHRETRRRVSAAAAPLAEVCAHLRRVLHRDWPITVRLADQLFFSLVRSSHGGASHGWAPDWALPAGWITDLTHWAGAHGWRLSATGRKVHLVPAALTKSAAITELASRTGTRLVLAAGDSLLDADLLRQADAAIHPAHGELAATGWSHPTVACTRSAGVAAGAEILHWLCTTAASPDVYWPVAGLAPLRRGASLHHSAPGGLRSALLHPLPGPAWLAAIMPPCSRSTSAMTG